MKKLLALMLAMLMTAALLPLNLEIAAADTYSGSCGENLTWTFDTSTGHLTIAGTGEMKIPYDEGNEGYYPEWYDYRSSIKTVEIQDGVTSVAGSAFSGYRQLRSVTMGSSVTAIGYRAFYDCQTLSSVSGGSITSIGKQAFCDCKALDSITLAEGLTEITDSAFSGCAELPSITIPDSVTSIGRSAFSGCTGLQSIAIPDNVTRIGLDSDYAGGAFSGCTGLTDVTIGSSVTIVGRNTFSGCTGLQSITFPDSVTIIGGYAFSGCTGIHSITIPDSVKRIGEHAFYGCTELADIQLGPGIETIGLDAFLNTAWMDVQADGPVYMRDILIVYKGECPEAYTVDEGTVIIGDGAFYGQQGLKSIVIPTGVIAIGESAFENCKALTSVEIPDSVLTIDRFAFYHCDSLTSVELPPHLDKIMNMAFAYSGLVSVDIPYGVTEIRVGAFEGCPLTAVSIPDSVRIIEESAFFLCPELTEITIPDSVTVIGSYAFAWCNKLATVSMSKNIADFQDRVFEDTAWWDEQPDGLVYIDDILVGYKGDEPVDLVINNGTRVIGGMSFQDCENLKTIDIPDSMQYICRSAFRRCTGVEVVVIPDNVLVIRDEAFDECDSLTSVTLGSGLVEIGWGAFFSCPSLTDVWYNGTEAQYEERLKDGIVLEDGYEWDLFNAEWHFTDAYSGQCGDDLYWSFDKETGTLTITGSGDMWDNECGAMPWEDVTVEYVDSYGGAVLRDDPTVSLIHYIILPEGLTSIASGAFCGTLIESIEIPSTVKSILYMAFASCENLKSIAIPDGISQITWQCFSNCGQLESVTLPVSVTEVYEGAFWDCNAITDVYYQGTAEQRAEMTFGDDNEPLLNATWHYESDGPSEPVTGQCGENLFWSFDESTGTLTITGSGDMWDYSFQSPAPWMAVNDLGDPMIGYVLLPDELTHIGSYAFTNLYCLSGITIPGKVISIGKGAFSGCEGFFLSLTIPDSVTTIGQGAFWRCSIRSVTLSNNLSEIADGLFSECSSLTEIAIPDSVTSIGEGAFLGCAALNEITIPDGVKSIGESAFGRCENLESATVGKGITQIPDWAFWNCSALKQITISKNVTYVWPDAFMNCTALTDVYYEGTKAECEAQLTVLSNELNNATWHYLTPAFTPAVEWNAEDVKFKGSTPYVTANGSAQTPRFTVKNSADGSIVDPEFYDYEYRENTNAGTGYVIVTFKGDYTGECQGWFKIYLPATTNTYVENVSNGIQIKWDPVEGAAGYVIYRRAWSSTTNGWTDFVRWYNVTGTSWIDGSDDSHKVYAGSRYQYGVKAYFARRTDPVSGATIGGNVGDNFNLGEVGPLRTTVRITTRKLVQVRPGSKQMTVKWEASKNFTGYQIKYATDANFTKNVKAIKIGDPTTYWTTIKSLQSNTTYYVCIRSYHEFGGMTYFGEWSNVLSCKVK